jgi:opacity protein-like surface antigen
MKVFALIFLVTIGSAQAQDLAQGVFAANTNSEGWSLNAGAGTRYHIVFVRFSKAFVEQPVVVLGITAVDGAPARDGNIRVALKADNVTRDGFVVKISTWGESRLSGIEGSWLAFTK